MHAPDGGYTRSRGRRWAELAKSLARLRDPDPQTRAVLTMIGLLNAFGQQQELRASPAVIAFALHDMDMTEAVAPALQHLTTDQLITYRHHRDSYVLWEGSDLDLDTLVREALRQVGDRMDLAPLLQRSIQPIPLVARRHSYRTGAVRHFTVHFVTVDTTTALVPPLLTDDADGQILYLVPVDTVALTQTEQWVCHPDRAHATETCRIVVVPHQVQRLQDLLLEVTALQQVLATQPELEYDRVARRELASRLAEA
ncbi:MAG: hypothetical protein GFH27_549297n43 [Chloroflexi bacterium AL-W]|nr:hypothetical protein [Chloroflexi bacterium AL-N1]NOK68567.1 hypothetical protein [Chloroflexi bacterium AL-N10]NOK76053.1 hypothetical protein [Chloroflexi bacterium AL-N5]NOK82526.1 hypothetical protein [Chloroflexi bacterium AL-W]NOK92836.1 hypothetical protein [Chloroflexi bacterium AL-N15]